MKRTYRSPRRIALSIAVGGALIGVVAYVLKPPPRASSQVTASFIEPQTCFRCHETQHAAWTGSHHDLAMQEVTDETVLGDFSDVTFTHFGKTSRFFRKEGKYMVRTDGPDGEMADFAVRYVFGIEPLQQYLVEFDRGRLQVLTLCWDTEKKEWFDLHPDEPIGHTDELHWTGLNFNWNFMCAECHSTDLQRRYDPGTNGYGTTWTGIDVGCQACHGPGSKHVAWAQRVAKGEEMEDDPRLEVRLKGATAKVEVDACARCHSRRTIVHGDYRHGRDFLEHYEPRLLTERLYHADGQILDEVYVYGSFIQTKKYRRGVRCTDCHEPHTTKLLRKGNALCVHCHQPAPPQRFDTIAAKAYDTREHHFHEPATPGSRCVDCHMPATTYMVVDPRRDHSFRVPRPDLTAEIGTPNACNRCHEHQTADWAVAAIRSWYPEGRTAKREPHFGETIAAGRAGDRSAFDGLAALAGNPERPAIVRATAVSLLPRAPRPEALEVVARALKDPDGLVRATAVDALAGLVPASAPAAYQRRKLAVLAPLLEDPLRLVRTEAVRVLSEVPPEFLDAQQRAAFDQALEEYRERQESGADRSAAHLNLGVLYANLRRPDLAERSYRRAQELDPLFLPAWFNLANLLNAQGRNGEAEQTLGEVIARVPESGEAHYSMGLLLAEMDRLPDAAEHLARAVQLMPRRARVRYNYALVLQHLDRRADAARELRAAHDLEPRDPGILQALAIFYMQEGKPRDALPWAQKLAELAPNDPAGAQLVRRIRSQIPR